MSADTSLRDNNFDLLRLLAALQVAFSHASLGLRIPTDWLPEFVETLLTQALPGVPIFFVISGFLISASWESNSGAYFRNRFLRIYPALWVCLGISIVTAAVFGGVNFLRIDAVPWLAAQLTIGQFYNPVFLRDYGVGVLNWSLWTIPVELQFYLLLPLLYSGFRLHERRGNFEIMFLVLVSVCTSYYFGTVHTPLADSFALKLLAISIAPYLYMFLLGVLLQRNFKSLAPYVKGRAPIWTITYVGVVAGFYGSGIPISGNIYNQALMVLLAPVVVSWAFTSPGLGRFLKGNDFSYGIYIYHMVIVNVLISLGLVGNPLYLPFAIFLIVLAGCLSWVAVERPALALKRKSIHPIALNSIGES